MNPNPFAHFQGANTVPTNPFWSGVNQGQQEAQTRPFMDMARQSQGMDLQKQSIELGEFADPRAVQARMTGHDAKTAQNQYTINTEPVRSRKDIETMNQEIRSLPHVTDQKIAQAQEAVRKAKGAPAEALYQDMGNLYQTLRETPESGRALLYEQAIQRWQDKNPGSPLPEQMRTYSPQRMSELAAIRYAQVNTPEHAQTMDKAGLQSDTALQVENLQQTGANYRADVGARATVGAARVRAQESETPPKAIARLRRELRANPGDEAARGELVGYLEENFMQRFQQDSLGQIMAAQASSGPQAMQAFQVYREQEKFKLFANEGIYGTLDRGERDWVLRNIGTNPNMGIENIIAEGRKRGKIGGKK